VSASGPHLSICDPRNLEHQLDAGATGAVCARGIPTFEGYEISPDINVPLDRSSFSSEGWFDSGDADE
jgi:non-ribosomal peptide synthetase component E (peptide arylation enzyme)